MRYEVTTSLTPEEVIEDALHYFGPGSTGLEVTSQTSQGVVFQGGGGHVAIQVQPGATTTVDIETREWGYVQSSCNLFQRHACLQKMSIKTNIWPRSSCGMPRLYENHFLGVPRLDIQK